MLLRPFERLGFFLVVAKQLLVNLGRVALDQVVDGFAGRLSRPDLLHEQLEVSLPSAEERDRFVLVRGQGLIESSELGRDVLQRRVGRGVVESDEVERLGRESLGERFGRRDRVGSEDHVCDLREGINEQRLLRLTLILKS